MLSVDLTSTAIVYDAPVCITLKLEAVKAGPYNADTYRQIFQEVEERLCDVEKRGSVYTVRIGSKRYVAHKGVDTFQKVAVKDVLDELVYALSACGIKPEMNFSFGEVGGRGAPPGRGPPPSCTAQISRSSYTRSTATLVEPADAGGLLLPALWLRIPRQTKAFYQISTMWKDVAQLW